MKSYNLQLGTKEESTALLKSIEELEELKKEATETIDSLRSDVQCLRLGLNEMFAMQYEASHKNSSFKNEK